MPGISKFICSPANDKQAASIARSQPNNNIRFFLIARVRTMRVYRMLLSVWPLMASAATASATPGDKQKPRVRP